MIFRSVLPLLYSACAAALALQPHSSSSVLSRDVEASVNSSKCRCFPGDACWPSRSEWSQFNKTINGKLVATIPLASVCHNSGFGRYDADACAKLISVWDYPVTHYESSSSPMAPFFANMSCDPFTPPDAQCVVGSLIQYAVNASSAQDYQSTIAFAQQHNIRLVIRNTGHDYFGKSTGAGGLAIWTHHLKDITVSDYSSQHYTGKAIKVGAGVQNGEAQRVAHANGLVVVGGDSSTVGLAGGYSQGGGHGPLVSTLGLAADQTLEWEVVTSTGKHLIATPYENSDLYWALSGGGGGTYAAVLSLTVKAHPDFDLVSVGNLTFNLETTSEAFWDSFTVFLGSLTKITDAGAVCIWMLSNASFAIQSVTAPNLDSKQLTALLQPTIDQLERVKLPYQYAVKDFPNFLDSFHSMSADPNVTQANIGGRLIPRSLLSNDSVATLTDALRFVVDEGAILSGLSVNVNRTPSAPNSVNPLWRSTAFSSVFGTYYNHLDNSANIADQELIRSSMVPRLSAITPNGAAYLNEADFGQSDFQQVFYGSNYDKLLAIKRKYDPNDTFYGQTAVGSEYWEIRQDGRLCKVT
ncbi:FAD binding domain-containing protein [Daldinia loculata]|nr:FAD binding domain-containing protein [Daldinia loculata]